MIKGSFNLKDRRISHCKSAPCLVSCLRVFCRWFFWYNVFNLSRDLSWPLHCGVMPIYGCEHLVVYDQPSKSCGHKHCDIASIIFSICHVIFRENVFKGLCQFMVDPPRRELPPCHVWWALAQCKWRYKVFYMSSDLTKARDWKIKSLYEWELFLVCHHLATFGDHRYCSFRYIMFLVYHVIKQDQVIKGSSDYNDMSSLR